MMLNKILVLRIIHAIFSLYFIACLLYLYYAAYAMRFDVLLLISMASLAIEGTAVFILNSGNCPLIHVQKRIGDDRPFFELFMPPRIAKQAIPAFSVLVIIALVLLVVRFGGAIN